MFWIYTRIVAFAKKYIKKLLNLRKSIIGKMISLVTMIFVLMVTPVIIQTYASFTQAREYKNIIDNIDGANRLNTIVSTDIEPLVWDIVAGKVKFEESGIMELIANIRERMYYISDNNYSTENNAAIEFSIRALNILENYVSRLERQIKDRAPVAENENILEEIRGVVAVINDFLQDFSSEQISSIAILNEEMSQRSNWTFWLSIGLMVAVILIGFFAFLYIANGLMNPIEKLVSMSSKIAEGNFSARIELSASEEFNDLASSMNTMSEKIEILISKSIEEQKQLQILEAKALQAQITPHFLYNTLDAIIWAAEAKNTSDVITLVSCLSSFFRITLSHGIDFISISDEILHVRSYLAIQQMRYSDVLTYEINVDDDLCDQKVLKLLLQPIVENSLYHGIKNTRERGKIIISVTKAENGIKFMIEDNGIGMTEEQLLALKDGLKSGRGNETSYGLFNVNRRLQLYYDLSDGIEIESEYKKGTKVSFVLNMTK